MNGQMNKELSCLLAVPQDPDSYHTALSSASPENLLFPVSYQFNKGPITTQSPGQTLGC